MTAIDPEIAGVFTDTPADLQLLLDQYVAYEAAPADYQSEGEVVPEDCGEAAGEAILDRK